MLKPLEFYSNGKLLITAEYLVLNEAKALALPTVFGQTLQVKQKKDNTEIIHWKSYDYDKSIWFEASFTTTNFRIIAFESLSNSYKKTALKLQEILKKCRELNSTFLQTKNGFFVETNLNFPKNWGLGTSSTLINNIAKWANINPFTLQFSIFGGSAYDIACAQNDFPILYQLKDKTPSITKTTFQPKFSNNLFFVYLNKKQNSRSAIAHYQKKQIDLKSIISQINTITNQLLDANISLKEFELLLEKHEQIISNIIQKKPIKQQLFPDYFGAIKSLGAWEGDFILVTGNEKTLVYFKSKGYTTILKYTDMIHHL